MSFLLWTVFLNLFFLYFVAADSVSSKIVDTNYGPVKGFEFDTISGEVADIFLGIPFARPPVDELRFEYPKPVGKHKSIYQATSWKASCHSFFPLFVHPSKLVESEDCLYLNVFAPKNLPKIAEKYPVLLWIHGGGYFDGSAEYHGFTALSNNFVSKGIVVVTIQYRLGPFGFIGVNDSSFLGNYGLHDQAMALQYVHENVHHFGGDPDRITIWGESAGAASVASLSLSTKTRNLFSQIIQNSGSLFMNWGQAMPIVTKVLSESLECPTDDVKLLKQCLKGKPVEAFRDSFSKMLQKGFRTHPWIDGNFFDDEIDQLIETAPPKPTMMSLAEMESIWFAGVPKLFGTDLTRIPNLDERVFDNLLNNRIHEDDFDNVQKIRQKVIDFYCQKSNKLDTVQSGEFYFEKYNELHSDLFANIGAIRETKMKVENGWPIYFYINNFTNPDMIASHIPLKKATHVIEYPYIFNVTTLPFDTGYSFNDDDKAFSKLLVDSLVNFVKTGDPSSDGLKWETITNPDNVKYMDLKPHNPQMKDHLWGERVRFWDRFSEEYKIDPVRGGKLEGFGRNKNIEL